MRIVQINATCGVGSTGKICSDISKMLSMECIDNRVLYSTGNCDFMNSIKCADRCYIKIQAAKSHFWGNYGFNSSRLTYRIIEEIEKFDADLVHLHNIHGHDCNIEKLFDYFKKNQTKVIWTFHDCWSFTGYCTHFTMCGCDKWKTGCEICPQRKYYSMLFDRSKSMFLRKKEALLGLNLTIVTPSQWLADLVKQSFLKDYPVRVINNGIDLSAFKPTEGEFRKRHGLLGKKIVLGVSFNWDERKGLDIFQLLSEKLGPDYQVVIVGTNDRIDKDLPKTIISIHRTHNQSELAELYSTSDVFVNPTREENYPTVNMESLACGTPVITFRTGGSPETIDSNSGRTVDVDDFDGLLESIISVCEEGIISRDACMKRAESFDKNKRYSEYIDLYKEIYEQSAKG